MWSREMEKEPQGRVRREGFSFHGLRTLAVAALAEMVDAIRIAAITGQSLNVVERYLKDHRQRELALAGDQSVGECCVTAFYKCAVCFPDVPGALVKRKS